MSELQRLMMSAVEEAMKYQQRMNTWTRTEQLSINIVQLVRTCASFDEIRTDGMDQVFK